MTAVDLVSGLSGARCGECAGVWVGRGNYDSWRTKHPGDIPENPVPVQLAANEPHTSKVCPQCGHLLLPYRVGHGLPFSIDYCGACGGVWLDPNEWDAIKAKNLHDNLHQIVSSQWQADVRHAEVQKAIEEAHRLHLGATYDKAREVRSWLRTQPQRTLILAYLSDEAPEGK